jgi:hypothetical protein
MKKTWFSTRVCLRPDFDLILTDSETNFFSFLTGVTLSAAFCFCFFKTAGMLSTILNYLNKLNADVPRGLLNRLVFASLNRFGSKQNHRSREFYSNLEPIMDNISNVRLGPLPNDSPYMKPFRLYFEQNGRVKNWGELEKFLKN